MRTAALKVHHVDFGKEIASLMSNAREIWFVGLGWMFVRWLMTTGGPTRDTVGTAVILAAVIISIT